MSSSSGRAGKLPLIAIVGRPNVGKSTLFNRITGKHRALVSREPGMTRDRRIEKADWAGRHFQVIDTGGLQDDPDTISRLISTQARKAIRDSELILFVVDGPEGMTAQDQEIASFLRKADRPVVLLINKIDTLSKAGTLESDFYRFGFERVFSISAEHGLNVDEVLDYAVEKLQLEQQEAPEKEEAVSVAILGKPNAGKSTFLNTLLGEERLVTSEIPGTTRDTIDIEVRAEDQLYRFIDTAGIRKKGQTKTVPDKLAVIHARKSLERASIACIMIDCAEGLTHQDEVVAGYAREAGKAIVVLFNKMDLLTAEARKKLEMELESKLQFISFAPQLFISAKTGQNVRKVFPLLKQVYESYTKRVSTGELNAFFDRALTDRYLGNHRGKPIKLRYITQTGTQPPVFVLFTNVAPRLHFSHIRFVENRLRAEFGFEGSTIRIKIRSGKRKT